MVSVYLNGTMVSSSTTSYENQYYKNIKATNINGSISKILIFNGLLSSSDINCLNTNTPKDCLGDQIPELPSAIQSEQVYPIYSSRLIPYYTQFVDDKGTSYTYIGSHVNGGQILVDMIDPSNNLDNSDATFVYKRIKDTKYSIVEDTYGSIYPTGLPAFNYSILSEEEIYGVNGWKSAYDEEFIFNGKYLIQTFFEYIRITTLRGVPLYTVLTQLANNRGSQYVVSAVGGSVRDLARNSAVSDVDIATSIPYYDIQTRLRDIFKVYGTPVDDIVIEATGKRKQFGMVKMLNIPPVDDIIIDTCTITKSDPLDIGPFKSIAAYSSVSFTKFLNKYSWQQDQKNSKYLYGFSYAKDASTRDYSVNAVYLEAFGTNPKIIDVFGNGIADAKTNTLRFAKYPDGDKNWKDLFEDDIGAQFRFWKFMMKTGEETWYLPPGEESFMAFQVCFNTKIWTFKVTDDTGLFWNKMYKKLFKQGMVVSEVDNVLRKWKLSIEDLTSRGVSNDVVDECREMWNTILDYSQSQHTYEFLKGLSGESNDAFGMAQIIYRWREQEYFDMNDYRTFKQKPIKSTMKDEVSVDQDIVDQFICYFSEYGPILTNSSDITLATLDTDESTFYDDEDDTDDDGGYLEGVIGPIWNDLSLYSPTSFSLLSADRLFIAYTYIDNYYTSNIFDQYAASIASGDEFSWEINALVLESEDILENTLVELLQLVTSDNIAVYAESLLTAALYPNSTENLCLQNAINFCLVSDPQANEINNRRACSVFSILAARIKQEYWHTYGLFIPSDAPNVVNINNTIQLYPNTIWNDFFNVLYGVGSNQTEIPQTLLNTIKEQSSCDLSGLEQFYSYEIEVTEENEGYVGQSSPSSSSVSVALIITFCIATIALLLVLLLILTFVITLIIWKKKKLQFTKLIYFYLGYII